MIGLILLLATNFLSGYSIFRIFFKKANTFEKIVLPQAFSLIVTPSLFVILYLLVGFDSAIWLLPLIIVSMFIISLRKKQENIKLKFDKRVILFLLLLVVAFGILIIFQFFFQLPSLQDTTNYIAIANQIKNYKTLPPENPCLYGTTLNYQWFYHLFLAIISVYSGINVFWVVPAFTIYLLFILLLAGFLLGYSYFKKEIFGIAFVTVVLLVFYFYYTAPQPQGYSLIIFMLLFYTLLQLIETKSNAFAFLTGIVAASIMYIHGLSFILAGLLLFAYSLYKIIFNFNKKTIIQLVVLLAPLVLSLPYYFIIEKYVTGAFLFEPFEGLVFNYVRTFNVLLLLLPFGIYEILKKGQDKQMVFLMLLIALFMFVNAFTTLRSNAIDRFVTYMIFPILFISLEFLKGQRQIIAYVALIAVFVFFFYNVVVHLDFTSKENFSSLDEYVTSTWIKENSNTNETVLTSPSSIYAAIGERKILLCEPLVQSSFFYDPRGQFSDLILMYTSPSQDLYEKYNVKYVVLGSKEYDFFFKYDLAPYDFNNSKAFVKVFEYRNSTVFAVRNTTALSMYTNVTTRNNLNFTSYSRWWEI